ncbi:hypothetical protein CDAR_49101 [Caerostris darwini]|uniref:Uncharacterized protein n=1 Tax=Caerostris darwini TaxID=1538125 RepID=A0AAV4NHQ8_9ARAC|nr:hypothetical protein CDAR_49101 [Caerostris darwini]
MSNYSPTSASKRKLRRNSFVENHSEGNVPNSGRSPQGIAIRVLACFLERAPSIPAGKLFGLVGGKLENVLGERDELARKWDETEYDERVGVRLPHTPLSSSLEKDCQRCC